MAKVTSSGAFMSLNLVAYQVMGMDANMVRSVYPSCLMEILHELVSKPRLRTICGTTELTAL